MLREKEREEVVRGIEREGERYAKLLGNIHAAFKSNACRLIIIIEFSVILLLLLFTSTIFISDSFSLHLSKNSNSSCDVARGN